MFNFRSGRMLFALASALIGAALIEAKARSINMQKGRPNLPPSAWRREPSGVKRSRSAVARRRRALNAGARRSARKRAKARKCG